MVKLDRCVRIRISKILHDAQFAQFISFELNLDFDRYVGQTFQVRKGKYDNKFFLVCKIASVI